MGEHTDILYCDSTLNLMMGCDGCELHNPKEPEKSTCYAAALTRLHGGNPGWPVSFDTPQLFPDRLRAALRWPDLTGKERPEKPWLNGYPRIVFVDDLGDTWTESLPWDWLAPYLPAMADSPHLWLFSTKRPCGAMKLFDRYEAPRNFMLMVTVTSQATAHRAEELQFVRIRYRGISAEPLLGPLNLRRIARQDPLLSDSSLDVLTGDISDAGGKRGFGPPLDFVFAGFQSGPRALPGHPQWAWDLRDQVTGAGVPFFWKQWGEWAPYRAAGLYRGTKRADYTDGVCMLRVGKKAAGRLLDDHEWSQMPEVRR